MPSIKDLRRRIKSIKNTSQITKAMEMVAATKMRRSQIQALGGRPYNQALEALVNLLIVSPTNLNHSLLQPNKSKTHLVILLSTDKSLCGALNTNLFRMVNNDFKSESTKFITVGIKGRTFLTRTSRDLVADFPNNDVIDENLSKQIRQMIVSKFEADEIGSVSIVFPNFVSTLTQTPHVTPLLPIDPTNFLKFVESVTKKVTESGKNAKDYNIEPDLNTVLEYALQHFLDVSIYQALCETKASEHSARMIAMQNATKNAKDLVTDLTLAYNQIRQDAITNELLEISSAQAALN